MRQRREIKSTCCAVAVAGLLATAFACGRTTPDLQGLGLAVSVRTVDNSADVGKFSSTKLDDVGTPHIAYYDLTNQDLKYAVLDQISGDWVLETVDRTGDVGSYPSLGIDPNTNLPRIAYYDAINNRVKYAWLDNERVWHVQTMGTNKSDPTKPFVPAGGYFVTMAIDSAGRSHIAYAATPDEDNPAYRAIYAVYDHAADIATAYAVGDNALYIDHGVDYRGGMKIVLRPVGTAERPILLFYRADQKYGVLELVSYDPENPAATLAGPMKGWVTTTLAGTYYPANPRERTDVGRFLDAALEHAVSGAQVSDYLHISYYNGRQGDLNYLKYDLTQAAPGKRIIPVDQPGLVGEGTSILLLPEKRSQAGVRPRTPVVAYYDATNNDLKLAFQTYDLAAGILADEWRATQVDLPGMVGQNPSMVLINPSQVGVSYHDIGKRSLKFAIVDVSF